MTEQNLIWAAYLLVGFCFVLVAFRKINGPLSIVDLLICAAWSSMWPLLLLILAAAGAMSKDNWFTRKRF